VHSPEWLVNERYPAKRIPFACTMAMEPKIAGVMTSSGGIAPAGTISSASNEMVNFAALARWEFEIARRQAVSEVCRVHRPSLAALINA